MRDQRPEGQKGNNHPRFKLEEPDRTASFYAEKNVQKRALRAQRINVAIEEMRDLAENQSEDAEASRQLLKEITAAQTDGGALHSLFNFLYQTDDNEESLLPDGAMAVLATAGAVDREWAGEDMSQKLIGASATIWKTIAAKAANLAKDENMILTPALGAVLDSALHATSRRSEAGGGYYPHWALKNDQDKEKAWTAIQRTPAAAALNTLLGWIDKTTDPEELSWLADYPYPAIVETVSTRSPAARTAAGVGALAMGKRADSIARNPHLNEEGVIQLLDVFIERVKERSEAVDTDFLSEEIGKRKWRFNESQMARLRAVALEDLDKPEDDIPWGGVRPAEQIAHIDQVIMEDEIVRAKMADSREPVIQVRILETSKGKEWLRSIGILEEIDKYEREGRISGHHLALALPHTKDSQVEGLRRGDLVGLVAHENAHVRATGHRLMKVIGQSPTNQGDGKRKCR